MEKVKAGVSVTTIAKDYNIAIPTVYRIINKWFKATIIPLADGARKLELARLDKYLKALDLKIEEGDTKAVVAAIAVSQRRAKLLGLDEKTTIDINTSGVVKVIGGIDEALVLGEKTDG
jgi:transposase